MGPESHVSFQRTEVTKGLPTYNTYELQQAQHGMITLGVSSGKHAFSVTNNSLTRLKARSTRGE